MESLHLPYQQVPEPDLHTWGRPGIVQSSCKPWLGVRVRSKGLGLGVRSTRCPCGVRGMEHTLSVWSLFTCHTSKFLNLLYTPGADQVQCSQVINLGWGLGVRG